MFRNIRPPGFVLLLVVIVAVIGLNTANTAVMANPHAQNDQITATSAPDGQQVGINGETIVNQMLGMDGNTANVAILGDVATNITDATVAIDSQQIVRGTSATYTGNQGYDVSKTPIISSALFVGRGSGLPNVPTIATTATSPPTSTETTTADQLTRNVVLILPTITTTTGFLPSVGSGLVLKI